MKTIKLLTMFTIETALTLSLVAFEVTGESLQFNY